MPDWLTRAEFTACLFFRCGSLPSTLVASLLQGVSMHLGFGGLGMAVPDRVFEFQVKQYPSLLDFCALASLGSSPTESLNFRYSNTRL
jgi:hypothetical protein